MNLLIGEGGPCLALIRIRGSVGIRKELEYVFKLMHLPRKNHAVLIGGTPSNLRAIQKVKDYATWGNYSRLPQILESL